MKATLSCILLSAAVLVTVAPAFADGTAATPAAPAATSSKPLRHLVYSFNFDVNQQGEVTNDPGTSGARNYTAAINDTGTITVDVMKEAPDHGLVVVVSEQANKTRSAQPAECAVYGNTNVLCDPNKTVNNEEYTILRFLAQNFVDPNNIDSNKEWKITHSDATMDLNSTYTIQSNNGGIMAISENRNLTQHGAGTVTSTVQSKIDYDFNRALPVSVDEYTIVRQYGGIQSTSTATYQTTLKLVSDSMAKT